MCNIFALPTSPLQPCYGLGPYSAWQEQPPGRPNTASQCETQVQQSAEVGCRAGQQKRCNMGSLPGVVSRALSNKTNSKMCSRFMMMYGSTEAFDALRKDGTVVTWGTASHGGDSCVQQWLKNMQKR